MANPTEPEPRWRLHLAVRGWVHETGFPQFAADKARVLGLHARIKEVGAHSRGDAAIEITADGPRDRLEAFEVQIRKGPRLARIDGVGLRWEELV